MSYQAKEIEVLSGLDPVRKRPGMYTHTENPNHLAMEVIDNCVDEALAGHAKTITVTVLADGGLCVQDDGRGMPVDEHPEHKVPGVVLILTKLHAGAKFSEKTYEYSGGLHGVGVSVVNALSRRLEVRVKQHGQAHLIAFEQGHEVEPLIQTHEVKKRETGTQVTFWPEPKYFDQPSFQKKSLKKQVHAKAILCPGLTIHWCEEATDTQETWCYQTGLSEYLCAQFSPEEQWLDAPFSGQYKGELGELDWAILWTTGPTQYTDSYVNLIPTPIGGTHVNGLRTGLVEAMRHFCELHTLLPRGLKIKPEDVLSHSQLVCSVKIKDPQFSGQTKERLASRNVAHWVAKEINDRFSLWLNDSLSRGEALATWVIEQAQKRERAQKKVTRKKIVSGPKLPGKLADCISQDPDTELFLVEGDSAGGSAKQARNREFQAVLPLRGKILNTWEVGEDQVLASQTVHDIAIAIGVDPGSDSLEGCRYGKICILADADSDGNHIATLLCVLFFKHFPALVASGRLYVAMPPLYRIDCGKKVFYALDESEKVQILTEHDPKNKANVQRFKGLGEMNPNQLRETTMAVDTRRLVQLTVEDMAGSEEMLQLLFAKKSSAARREWLADRGDLAIV